MFPHSRSAFRNPIRGIYIPPRIQPTITWSLQQTLKKQEWKSDLGLLQGHGTEPVPSDHPPSVSRKSRTSAKADPPPSPTGGTAPCPASCPPAPGLAPSSNLGTSIVAKMGGFTNHLLVNCSTFSEMYLNTVMSKTLCCILMKTRRVLHHSSINLQFRGLQITF